MRTETFETVLGSGPSVVEAAILNDEVAGETSLDKVLDSFSEVFGLTKQDALRVLGSLFG